MGAPDKAQGTCKVTEGFLEEVAHRLRGRMVKTAILEMGLGEEQVWERC